MDPQGAGLPETATLSEQSPLVLFKERYRLSRALGSGGFGTVYLADDTQLHNRQVVVKILHQHGEAQGWIHKKFREECEALALGSLTRLPVMGLTAMYEEVNRPTFGRTTRHRAFPTERKGRAERQGPRGSRG
jgi:hypothetical protein